MHKQVLKQLQMVLVAVAVTKNKVDKVQDQLTLHQMVHQAVS